LILIVPDRDEDAGSKRKTLRQRPLRKFWGEALVVLRRIAIWEGDWVEEQTV
jgi:hypothetical protein